MFELVTMDQYILDLHLSEIKREEIRSERYLDIVPNKLFDDSTTSPFIFNRSTVLAYYFGATHNVIFPRRGTPMALGFKRAT